MVAKKTSQKRTQGTKVPTTDLETQFHCICLVGQIMQLGYQVGPTGDHPLLLLLPALDKQRRHAPYDAMSLAVLLPRIWREVVINLKDDPLPHTRSGGARTPIAIIESGLKNKG